MFCLLSKNVELPPRCWWIPSWPFSFDIMGHCIDADWPLLICCDWYRPRDRSLCYRSCLVTLTFTAHCFVSLFIYFVFVFISVCYSGVFSWLVRHLSELLSRHLALNPRTLSGTDTYTHSHSHIHTHTHTATLTKYTHIFTNSTLHESVNQSLFDQITWARIWYWHTHTNLIFFY